LPRLKKLWFEASLHVLRAAALLLGDLAVHNIPAPLEVGHDVTAPCGISLAARLNPAA
jgi:hypothetical protein